MALLRKDAVNKILLSIGDNGTTIVHVGGDHLYSRFFAKTPHDVDTTKLRNLLKDNESAEIHIFINDSGQKFENIYFPLASQLNLRKAAKAWMNTELTKYQLKLFQPISRDETSKGWVLTFCYSDVSEEVSKWIEMLGEYKNIINGIYFLSYETGQLVAVITENKGWNILLSESLASGIRLSIFYDDKIVTSKILEHHAELNLDFTAGIIEVEISNAVDYISKLAFGKDSLIECHLILIEDLANKIRIKNFEKVTFKISSPKDIFDKIGFFETLSERDRYFDSVILTYLSIYTAPKERFHIEQTEDQFKFISKVNFLQQTFKLINILGCLLVVWIFHDLSLKLSEFNTNHIYYDNLLDDIAATKGRVREISDSVPYELNIDQINEVVDCHLFLSGSKQSPTLMLEMLGKSLKDEKVANSFEWNYFNNSLINIQQKKDLDFRSPVNKEYKIKTKVNLDLDIAEGKQDNKQKVDSITKRIIDNISQLMPGYTVDYTSKVAGKKELVEVSIDTANSNKKIGE